MNKETRRFIIGLIGIAIGIKLAWLDLQLFDANGWTVAFVVWLIVSGLCVISGFKVVNDTIK